ncbi:hypothetical protein ACOME3_006286 [Neoechinorhynchus agilis]
MTESESDSGLTTKHYNTPGRHIRFADAAGQKLVTWFSSSGSSSSLTSSMAQPTLMPSLDKIKQAFYRWEPQELICPERPAPVRLLLWRSINAFGDEQSGILSGNVFVSPQFDRSQVNLLIRYTYDDWRTYMDQPCHQSKTNESYFIYNLIMPPYMDIMDVYFAVKMITSFGDEHWDNNGGQNFHVQRYKLY